MAGMGRKADLPLSGRPQELPTNGGGATHQLFASADSQVFCRFWANAEFIDFTSRRLQYGIHDPISYSRIR
jgi:hypothetical protein